MRDSQITKCVRTKKKKKLKILFCAWIEESPYKFAPYLLRGNNGLWAEIMKSQ